MIDFSKPLMCCYGPIEYLVNESKDGFMVKLHDGNKWLVDKYGRPYVRHMPMVWNTK